MKNGKEIRRAWVPLAAMSEGVGGPLIFIPIQFYR